MIGLKLFLRDFASFSDIPFDTLYERQRELVRCGLLPTRGGRGPGSGVPLTADTLATFLIGLLATDSLSDIGAYTSQLSAARPLVIGPKHTTRSRNRTFHSDVAKAILGSRISGFQPGDDLTKNLYCGMLVTRHWRGMLLQTHEVGYSGGRKVDGLQGIEYSVGEDARLESSIISHTVSIEMEPWWMLCLRFRHALNIDERGS